MALLNLSLPNFNEADLSDEKQRRRIMNYLVKLDEQLRFVLSNLDEENVTETFRTEIIKAAREDRTRETVSVKEIQNELGKLSTEIRQAYDAIELKLNASDLAAGVDTQNGILIDKNGVHIEGAAVEMNTTDGEEYLHVTGEGISASSLTASNVMPRYDGPQIIYVVPDAADELIEAGNYVRSLQDALDRVNGRYVPYNVYVQMQAGMTAYEEISLKGAYFAAGFAILGISSSHAKIVGRLSIRHCVGYVKVQYVDVNADFGMSGMFFMGNGIFAHVINCVITGMGVAGNDNSRCIGIEDGAKLHAENCELYDSARAVMAFTMSTAYLKNIKGNCRYYVDASLIYASGTAACDTGTFEWKEWNAGELRNGVTAVDQGSGPMVEAIPQVSTYGLAASGHYSTEDGWDYFDSRDVYQGYTKNAKKLIGCMWFNDMSGLQGKEILQANLRLTRMSGIGRSSAVSVSLAALKSSAGETPVLGAAYGVIGSFEAGQPTTVTIPAEAAEALATGDIKGLALYTGETEVYKDRSYSKNYARFAGETSGTAETKPELAVIYR